MNIPILILGVIISILGVISLKKTLKLTKEGKETLAKIIKINQTKGSDEDGGVKYSYNPVLEFTTEDKKTHQVKSDVSSSNKNKYKIEDSLTILYHPDNPNQITVKSFMNMWLIPIGLLIIGVGVTIGSFLS